MNKKIKELWVSALRSGEYIQSRHALRTVSGYCCLGVLCDIASKQPDMGGWGIRAGEPVFVAKDGQVIKDELPYEVINWAELDSRNPNNKDGHSLAYMNDHGESFLKIADIIEREL